jgi:hypothetical protein
MIHCQVILTLYYLGPIPLTRYKVAACLIIIGFLEDALRLMKNEMKLFSFCATKYRATFDIDSYIFHSN